MNVTTKIFLLCSIQKRTIETTLFQNPHHEGARSLETFWHTQTSIGPKEENPQGAWCIITRKDSQNTDSLYIPDTPIYFPFMKIKIVNADFREWNKYTDFTVTFSTARTDVTQNRKRKERIAKKTSQSTLKVIDEVLAANGAFPFPARALTKFWSVAAHHVPENHKWFSIIIMCL